MIPSGRYFDFIILLAKAAWLVLVEGRRSKMEGGRWKVELKRQPMNQIVRVLTLLLDVLDSFHFADREPDSQCFGPCAKVGLRSIL